MEPTLSASDSNGHLVITVIAYTNAEAPHEMAAQGLDALDRKIQELTENRICLKVRIEPEASDHLKNDRKKVAKKWVVGVREPKQKPNSAYTLSMNFSKQLKYEDGTPGLEGIGGPYDCCIHTDFVSKVATTLHELLHTLQGQLVGGLLLPSVDCHKCFTYTGKEADSDANGWWNWYRALLTGNYSPQTDVTSE